MHICAAGGWAEEGHPLRGGASIPSPASFQPLQVTNAAGKFATLHEVTFRQRASAAGQRTQTSKQEDGVTGAVLLAS